MNNLNTYLNKLDKNNSDKLKMVIYKTPEDINKGLLRFNKSPKNTIFLFIMPKEEILHFHTVGMKFPIKIYFFNSDKKLVYSVKAKPGIKDINSKYLSKYVMEIPT